MKQRDYYSVLGITRDATPDEIQRAYRKCARTYHPDVNKNKDAESRFKEINEANDVLKDPEKRKLYDIYGDRWAEAQERGFDGSEHQQGPESFYHSYQSGGQGMGMDDDRLKDIFSNLFSGDFSYGSDGGYHSFDTGPRVYEAVIHLGLAEIIDAGIKTFSFTTRETNPATGQVEMQERKLKVRIPKGAGDGSVIRIKNFDKTSGSADADLLLTIRVLPDPRFAVAGHDLFTIVPVAPWEAAIGAKVPVETVKGAVKLAIPAGTRSGRKFRLKGKGLPRRDGGVGDIIVEARIQIPESLSGEEKRLFEELSRKSAYNPRMADGQMAGTSVSA